MANLVIPSGGTASNVIQLADLAVGQPGVYRLGGLVMPGGWDAATVTFNVDYGDGTMRGPAYAHDGTTATLLTILSADVVASRPYIFDAALSLLGLARAIQLVASAAQSGGARTFVPLLVRY